METYYKPVFLWEGRKTILPCIRKHIENTILANINAFARHINPHMKEWEESYMGPFDQTTEHGDLKETKDSVYLTYYYNNMVWEMHRFKPVKKSIFIFDWTVNDEMVLAARAYTGALVGIYWKPVEI